MPTPTLALPDANVLFPRTTRDWLLLLKNASGGGMFQVAYTEDILAETVYRLRRKHPDLSGSQLTIIRDRIVETMDSRIEDYPSGQDAEQIKDPFDRHLHAAAVAGRADCIITLDKGFTQLPPEARDQLNYEIYTPDEFFVLVDDSSSSTVISALSQQIEYWNRHPAATKDPSQALLDARCPDFAVRVKQHCRELARQG